MALIPPIPAPSCAVCGWPAMDTLQVCPGHRTALARLLDPAVTTSIPALYARLDVHPARAGAPADTEVHAMALRDRRTRPPDPDDPTDVVEVLTILSVITGLVAEHTDDPPPAGAVDAPAAAQWLHAHLDDLARHPWVAACGAQLERVQQHLLAAVGDPPPVRVGHCTHRVDDRGRPTPSGPVCGWPVYLDRLAPDQPAAGTCSLCGHVYTGVELLGLRQDART